MFTRRLLAVVAASLSVTLWQFDVLHAEPEASGFAGNWETTDCAAWWENGALNCEVWGDGSRMTLHIGPDDTPHVLLQDEYSTSCDSEGSSQSNRWVGAGIGEYEDIFLFVTLFKSGCGTSGTGGVDSLQLYWDSGSDTVWDDQDGDGWGYMWYRKN